jgi:hypothetical protein
MTKSEIDKEKCGQNETNNDKPAQNASANRENKEIINKSKSKRSELKSG